MKKSIVIEFFSRLKTLTDILATQNVWVAYINIADFKRRNMLVGHIAGDEDIQFLETCLKNYPIWHSARIGGDEWLVSGLVGQETDLSQFIKSFSRCDQTQLKFTIKNLETGITIEKFYAVEFRRAIRLTWAKVTDPLPLPADKRDAIFDSLLHLSRSSEVNTPNELTTASKPHAINRWSCIEPRLPPLHCSTCRSLKLVYTEGTSNISSGHCSECGERFESYYSIS